MSLENSTKHGTLGRVINSLNSKEKRPLYDKLKEIAEERERWDIKGGERNADHFSTCEGQERLKLNDSVRDALTLALTKIADGIREGLLDKVHRPVPGPCVVEAKNIPTLAQLDELLKRNA